MAVRRGATACQGRQPRLVYVLVRLADAADVFGFPGAAGQDGLLADLACLRSDYGRLLRPAGAGGPQIRARPALIYRRADLLDHRRPLGAVGLHRGAELLGRFPARRVAELRQAVGHRGLAERMFHRGVDPVDDLGIEAFRPEKAEPGVALVRSEERRV